ncbi:hypothetical protein SAMN04487996_10412 [Dyadobacter soli]|uniref:Uncharacterized protein n=1 Tax=Dyadobacter soli TaxID=659014 RepID=A0A1G7AY45_9BACT|nr:hypothetical protein [Dyadobacter soli]SDE19798.1 hypothetical protein SAMN04487996_10412 [Dyadobacter soli]
MTKITIRQTGKKLTNMEFQIINGAQQHAHEYDQLAMRLFLESEIDDWKRRDKYRGAPTRLLVRSQWEMALMNQDVELAIFKTIA